jgi:hypothetical protein
LFNRNIETLYFGIEAKQPKQTVSKQTEKKPKKQKYRKNRKKRENPKFSVKKSKICSLSNCFGWSSVCFGSFETLKLSVSVLKRNNRNKHVVSDSAETSFGSSFGCYKSKLISKDTLVSALVVRNTMELMSLAVHAELPSSLTDEGDEEWPI